LRRIIANRPTGVSRAASVLPWGMRSPGRRSLSSGAYRLLGLAVWRGARRYVRRRLPSRRALALRGLGAGAALAVAYVAVRRLGG
jgi:hypothetical protein